MPAADVRAMSTATTAARAEELPLIMGHEAAGAIAMVETNVRLFRVDGIKQFTLNHADEWG